MTQKKDRPKFLVRFIKEARVERAPRDPKKGGYEFDVIQKGTELEITAASVNFWQARNCIEVLSRVTETAPILANPFAIPAEAVEAVEKPRKVVVRAAVMNLFALVSDNKANPKPVNDIQPEAFAKAFGVVSGYIPAISDFLSGKCGEALAVLRADPRAGYVEIQKALAEIILELWPRIQK
jgi:hypothetical protein